MFHSRRRPGETGWLTRFNSSSTLGARGSYTMPLV